MIQHICIDKCRNQQLPIQIVQRFHVPRVIPFQIGRCRKLIQFISAHVIPTVTNTTGKTAPPRGHSVTWWWYPSQFPLLLLRLSSNRNKCRVRAQITSCRSVDFQTPNRFAYPFAYTHPTHQPSIALFSPRSWLE